MSKLRFDVDKFFTLPTTIGKLRGDDGYCALGAGLKSLGLDVIGKSIDLLGLTDDQRSKVVTTNDFGNPKLYTSIREEAQKRFPLPPILLGENPYSPAVRQIVSTQRRQWMNLQIVKFRDPDPIKAKQLLFKYLKNNPNIEFYGSMENGTSSTRNTGRKVEAECQVG